MPRWCHRSTKTPSALVFAIALALAYPARATDPGAVLPSTQVTVSGAVEHPFHFTVADLTAMTTSALEGVPVICSSGATLSRDNAYRGVLLRDLLNRAVLKLPGHFDKNHLIVVATATDGYQVLFSWHELFNSPTGEAVLVFFEANGQGLSDKDGRLALISAKDVLTGPRKVRNLQSIDVRLL